jgi:hypothetical protein
MKTGEVEVEVEVKVKVERWTSTSALTFSSNNSPNSSLIST